MAVFRVSTVRHLDAEGKQIRRKADWDQLAGQVVTRFYDSHGKLTRSEPKRPSKGPRKIRCVRLSKKWYGEFTGADGFKKRIALFTDQAASERELQDRQTHADKERLGLAAPREQEQHARRPLAEHLADYCAHLTRDGRSAQHVREVSSHAGWILKEGKFTTAAAVTHAKVLACLDTLRKRGRAAETCKGYWRRFGAFLSWLVREGRAQHHPLARIGYTATDRAERHPRRPLEDDEFNRLVNAAETSGRTVESVAGHDRAMLYVLARYTGLRRGELGSLTLRSFDLDSATPTVKVNGAYTKNGEEAEIPLQASVVAWVRAWLRDKGEVARDAPLLAVGRAEGAAKIGRGRGRLKAAAPRRGGRKTSKMMQIDLAAARKAWIDEAPTAGEAARRAEHHGFLRYLDEDGRYADFHSNRMGFVTELHRQGVAPMVVRDLARHKDSRTTEKHYTRLGVKDMRSGIEALPPAPRRAGEPLEAEEGRMTGTDGPSTSVALPGALDAARKCVAAIVAVEVAGTSDLDRADIHGQPVASRGHGARVAASPAAQVEPECDLVSTPETTPADIGSAGTVDRAGIEPATHGFSVRCSTN